MRYAPILITMIALATTGCVSAVSESARGAAAKVTIDQNMAAAKQGNREAQFKVGEALCCGFDDRAGFYNTRESVAWLCASAAQGYGPAMYKLGRIYAGDTVDGVRLARRAVNSLVGVSHNLPISYAWFANAKAYGIAEAEDSRQEIWKEMNSAQQKFAADQTAKGTQATCGWDEAMRNRL
jgi:TPR repeat protein